VHVVYSVLNPLPTGAAALQHSTYTLLTACRLVPWKGVTGLLDVLAALPEEVVLRIAGDGPERSVLEEKAKQLGVAKRVTFLGQLSRPALRAEKVAADAFLLNTSYEGLSHELLEVMDVGTPIVTTPVGGNPELVSNHETGLLVPVSDTEVWVAAVTALRSDQQLVAELTRAAQERTQAFTIEQSLEALHQLLQSQPQSHP
jgi:glycosyltransferase involved in cell wall biosynthesis